MGDNSSKRAAELELIRTVASQCKTAVVTGPARARWAGLSTLQWVTTVDLVLPGRTRAWGKTFPDRVYRNGIIRPEEIQVRDGVRIAKGLRGIFDSFRYYGRKEALVQLESARWQQRDLSVEKLLGLSKHLPRAKGTKEFRELIRYSGDTSASPLETLKRDTLLQAIDSGLLTGVESLEYQVGFDIRGRDGTPTVAYVDFLINGFIMVEADGDVKKDGTYGDAVDLTLSERYREVQLQNSGGEFVRTSWHDSAQSFIDQIQLKINRNPGVYQLPNRRSESFRDFLDRLEREWR